MWSQFTQYITVLQGSIFLFDLFNSPKRRHMTFDSTERVQYFTHKNVSKSRKKYKHVENDL